MTTGYKFNISKLEALNTLRRNKPHNNHKVVEGE